MLTYFKVDVDIFQGGMGSEKQQPASQNNGQGGGGVGFKLQAIATLSCHTPALPTPKIERKKDKSINFSHDDDNNYDNQTTFTSRTKYFAHSIESAGSIRQPDRYVATALEKCTI